MRFEGHDINLSSQLVHDCKSSATIPGIMVGIIFNINVTWRGNCHEKSVLRGARVLSLTVAIET